MVKFNLLLKKENFPEGPSGLFLSQQDERHKITDAQQVHYILYRGYYPNPPPFTIRHMLTKTNSQTGLHPHLFAVKEQQPEDTDGNGSIGKVKNRTKKDEMIFGAKQKSGKPRGCLGP